MEDAHNDASWRRTHALHRTSSLALAGACLTLSSRFSSGSLRIRWPCPFPSPLPSPSWLFGTARQSTSPPILPLRYATLPPSLPLSPPSPSPSFFLPPIHAKWIRPESNLCRSPLAIPHTRTPHLFSCFCGLCSRCVVVLSVFVSISCSVAGRRANRGSGRAAGTAPPSSSTLLHPPVTQLPSVWVVVHSAPAPSSLLFPNSPAEHVLPRMVPISKCIYLPARVPPFPTSSSRAGLPQHVHTLQRGLYPCPGHGATSRVGETHAPVCGGHRRTKWTCD